MSGTVNGIFLKYFIIYMPNINSGRHTVGSRFRMTGGFMYIVRANKKTATAPVTIGCFSNATLRNGNRI